MANKSDVNKFEMLIQKYINDTISYNEKEVLLAMFVIDYNKIAIYHEETKKRMISKLYGVK